MIKQLQPNYGPALIPTWMEGRTTEDTATDRHAYVRRASTLINSVPSYCGAQQDAVLALHVTLPTQEVMKHVDMSVYRLSCKNILHLSTKEYNYGIRSCQ